MERRGRDAEPSRVAQRVGAVADEHVNERTPWPLQALGALVPIAAQRDHSEPAGRLVQGAGTPAGPCDPCSQVRPRRWPATGAGRPVHMLHCRQNTHLASSSESVDFERHVGTLKPLAVRSLRTMYPVKLKELFLKRVEICACYYVTKP